MKDLVQLLIAKTGMPQEKATTAVELVLQYLRERLPPSVAAHLDQLPQGDDEDSSRRGGWNS